MAAPELNATGSHSPTEEKLVVPVIEEFLVTGTTSVETGRVMISKQVVEEQVSVDAGVTHEGVLVERKPINQFVDSAPPSIRQEGDVTIVSVVKEVLVVEKRLMLVEEVHIKKRREHYENIISHTLRKEEVTVTRTASGTDI